MVLARGCGLPGRGRAVAEQRGNVVPAARRTGWLGVGPARFTRGIVARVIVVGVVLVGVIVIGVVGGW